MHKFLLLLLLVVGVVFCSNEWKISTDNLLIDECLTRALLHLHDGYLDTKIRSQVSNIVCESETSSPSEIRLSFLLEKTPFRCFFYQTLAQIKTIRLQKCETIADRPSGVPNALTNEEEEEEDLQNVAPENNVKPVEPDLPDDDDEHDEEI